MTSEYKELKTELFEKLIIIQDKKDRELIETHLSNNNTLSCSVCGNDSIDFEVIIKATATISGDKEIEAIKNGTVMVIKPSECPNCKNNDFIELFSSNKDLYNQQIY